MRTFFLLHLSAWNCWSCHIRANIRTICTHPSLFSISSISYLLITIYLQLPVGSPTFSALFLSHSVSLLKITILEHSGHLKLDCILPIMIPSILRWKLVVNKIRNINLWELRIVILMDVLVDLYYCCNLGSSLSLC